MKNKTELDWKNLPFGYVQTNYNVRCYHRSGAWGELEVSSSERIDLHMASCCLHYGQEAFEGMKAFRGKNGEIRLFRWQENAKRLQSSAHGVVMAEVPDELFHDAITKVIKLNTDYVPPYGQGASLYIRPLLIGSGAQVGVGPANEYLFLVFVTPVGPYFKAGFNPVKVLITREFDRAAPLGTGHIKIGGNYAASLRSLQKAKEKGYSTALYLDAKEKKYIDECGPANFFAIKDNTYITPKSSSVLPSITNKSLMVLAKDLGLNVETRRIEVKELDTFDEVGACGTAAVITPISEILDEDNGMSYHYCKDGKPGPISTALYNKLTAIQCGDEVDKYGWIEIVK